VRLKDFKKHTMIIGGLAVSLASVMWGFDGIVLTPRLFNLDVIFVVFVLHLIPFLIMQAFLWKEYKHLKSFTLQDTVVFLLIATFGGFVGTAAIVKALFLVNFQDLSVVVLLQKLQPVFSITLAALILKETIRRRFALWATLAILSSYFLVFGFETPDLNTNSNTIYAALFALLASFSFGSSTVFSKKILTTYSFRTGTFFRYGFTTAILFLLVLFTGKLSQFEAVTPSNWAYFMIIAVTTGSGAIFLYYYGLIRINAMLATMCELFFPISAILFDYLFNGKVLSPVQWIAAAVMIFAIIRLNLPATPKSQGQSKKFKHTLNS
jgi:drug/metabolite transporter (DMT)-like permease